MKKMNKIVSLALVLAMVLSLTICASAASITITPPTVPEGAEETGITYTAYKIFDASISTVNGKTNVSYTIDSSSPYFSTVSAATDYFTLAQVGSTTTYNVTAKAAYTAEAANTFSETLKAVTGVTAAGTFVKQADGTYKLDGLADGYYLVTSSVGSDLILRTTGDVAANAKNDYPTQDKKVNGKDDYDTADMGASVPFTIDVTIPEDAVGTIVVHDTMTGLRYDDMTAVTGITASTEGLGDSCSVHFTLSDTYVAANKGNTVVVAYTAILTADVAKNESWVQDDTYESAHDNVKVYSTDIVINKVIADTTTPLSGAKFVLKNGTDANAKFYSVGANGVVSWVDSQEAATEVETAADGTAKFENVADGTYYLVETQAPTGYNLLTEPKTVIVTAVPQTDSETGETTIIDIVVDVENTSGTELPTTGGMGTTLFYVFGAVMVMGAAVLLVTKKRMAR